MPLILLSSAGLGLWSLFGGSPANPTLQTAQENKGINLTTAFGYLVVGGLVFYFGKKIIK